MSNNRCTGKSIMLESSILTKSQNVNTEEANIMTNENNKEHASQLNRQPWEPAGVVSVVNDDSTPKYGKDGRKHAKGGILSLEVDEVFQNKQIMEGSQNQFGTE